MNFVKTFPIQSGYYWCLNLNYPVPMIGYVTSVGLVSGGISHPRDSTYAEKYIRFGEFIETPTSTIIEE